MKIRWIVIAGVLTLMTVGFVVGPISPGGDPCKPLGACTPTPGGTFSPTMEPSATFEPSATSTATAEPSSTATPTQIEVDTPTITLTATDAATEIVVPCPFPVEGRVCHGGSG